MMRSWDVKIGGTRSLFVAGSTCEEGDRFHRIDLADAIVGEWTESVSHLWWSDISYAASKGKSVYTGTCGSYSEAPYLASVAPALCRLPGTTFSSCDSFESLALLATLFSLHDPECKARSGMGYSSILAQLERIESPIEARLLTHLDWQIRENTHLDLKAQEQIGSYRVDFAIRNYDDDDESHQVRLVIEADGHDFHEKTKEQVARDKQRERDLIKEGWTVLRFTGSEIWKNPTKCVEEILQVLGTLGAEVDF